MIKHSSTPPDTLSELVRNLATEPDPPAQLPTFPEAAFNQQGELVGEKEIALRDEYERAQAQFQDDRDRLELAVTGGDGRAYFRNLMLSVSTEQEAILFLEKSYETIAAFDDTQLTDRFETQTRKYLHKFHVRYELGRNFSLLPTIPGMFSKLMEELRAFSKQDEHIGELLEEFEEAFSDLRVKRTPAKMKTCLQKQFCLLEALGASNPKVTQSTMGKICDELDWPHSTIREAGKKLYGFRSSYPGMGHGGNPKGANRKIEMRDFVSISLMLAAFTPYFAAELDAERCYTS